MFGVLEGAMYVRQPPYFSTQPGASIKPLSEITSAHIPVLLEQIFRSRSEAAPLLSSQGKVISNVTNSAIQPVSYHIVDTTSKMQYPDIQKAPTQ